MRLVRIAWRDAIKRFKFLRCTGCFIDDGDSGQDWYIEEESRNGPYCPTCATKLAGATDEAHSVQQFYSNTRGSVTLSEHLL